MVGACFAVFRDISGEEKQAAGQNSEGDERVGIKAGPAKKKEARCKEQRDI